MPPQDEPRPKPAAQRQLTDLIVTELARVGEQPTIEFKRRSPTFGNYLDHDRLFDGSEHGPAYSPSRLWRLGPRAYDRVVDTLGPGIKNVSTIHQPFMIDETRGMIADFAAQQFADAATLQLLMMNCETIALYQTTGITRRVRDEVHIERRTPPEFQLIIETTVEPTIGQIEAAIKIEFGLLLGRQPSAQERQRFVSLFQQAAATAGNIEALQTMLMAIMLKPEAIYRLEIGFGERQDDGRRKLSPYELAFAIGYSLTDDSPDRIRIADDPDAERDSERTVSSRSLLELAESGELSTPADIQRPCWRF